VNDSPAEDKLCKITGGHVSPVPEEGNRVDFRLRFNAAFKFLNHVPAQFPVNNHLTHLPPVLFTRQEFKGKIAFQQGQYGVQVEGKIDIFNTLFHPVLGQGDPVHVPLLPEMPAVFRIIDADYRIGILFLGCNPALIIRFPLCNLPDNSVTGVPPDLNIPADLPVRFYLFYRVNKKREIKVFAQRGGEQGMESLENEDFFGAEGYRRIKCARGMIIHRFFYRYTPFEKDKVLFDLINPVRFRIQRGHSPFSAAIPVEKMVIIKGNRGYKIGTKDAADTFREGRLSRSTVPGYTQGKNIGRFCDRIFEIRVIHSSSRFWRVSGKNYLSSSPYSPPKKKVDTVKKRGLFRSWFFNRFEFFLFHRETAFAGVLELIF
jgi:hypothetical protein